MLLLQISAAQGPAECCLAVTKALQRLQQEADKLAVSLTIMEQEMAPRTHAFRSVIVALQGELANNLADAWCGTIQWCCPSPYRPNHGPKNWFIGVDRFEVAAIDQLSNDIVFTTIRSSGVGGQHVNKTNSAVRATHKSSGITVKVQTECSQHTNKRLAILLIAKKWEDHIAALQAKHKAIRRRLHHQIERGNPIRIFRGMDFE